MRLEFDKEAKLELKEARDQYEEVRKGLGRALVREMRAVAKRVASRPLSFTQIEGTRSRHALGKRFPYMLVFAIEGDVVRILSVTHQHRDPEFYLRR